MLTEEVWKVCEEAPRYEISNLGNLRTVKQQKLLANTVNSGGYVLNVLTVDLEEEGKTKKKGFYRHRLVATAFLDNPDELPCINHKDENKLNNALDNLEWCSYAYNTNYGTRNTRVAKKITKQAGRPHKKPVYVYDAETKEFVGYYESQSEAARQLGFRSEMISRCCAGYRLTSHGYIFSDNELDFPEKF